MKQQILRAARAALAPTRPSPDGPPARARVVLIDLDNLGLPGPGLAEPVLRALLAAAGSYDTALASGRDCCFHAYRHACQALGVRVCQAPAVRDGADRVLLTAAATLGDVGAMDFVVISADHAFASLPGRLHLVAPTGRGVSRALVARASSVTVVDLPRPSGGGRRRRRRSPVSGSAALAG